MEYSEETLQAMLAKQEMSSQQLQTLLNARSEGLIDFTLIDVREVYEYTDKSIQGTDLLLPTTMIQRHLDKLEALKESPVILYCRTGNRTGQVMHALRRMGHEKVVHLCDGIVAYRGETLRGAKLPNAL